MTRDTLVGGLLDLAGSDAVAHGYKPVAGALELLHSLGVGPLAHGVQHGVRLQEVLLAVLAGELHAVFGDLGDGDGAVPGHGLGHSGQEGGPVGG